MDRFFWLAEFWLAAVDGLLGAGVSLAAAAAAVEAGWEVVVVSTAELIPHWLWIIESIRVDMACFWLEEQSVLSNPDKMHPLASPKTLKKKCYLIDNRI